MSTDNWLATSAGVAFPPQRSRPQAPNNASGYSEELLEQVRAEVDGMTSALREMAVLPSNRSGDALGAAQSNLEDSLGERGFGSGAIDEVLQLLAERLTSIHGTLYGGHYGFGYGVSENEVGDIVRQLASLIWIFPEYNPLIKQMVEIRGLYVFGQGFEVKGESKERKRQKIEEVQIKRDQQKMEKEMIQQAAGQGAPGDESGAGAGETQGQDNAKNALFQRYGGTGTSSSMPKKSASNRREELDEATSPASGAAQGSRHATGGRPRHPRESSIAKCIREFWEDPCNIDRFCSVDAQQRLDKQMTVEGNAFVVIQKSAEEEGEGIPTATIWPTHSVHHIIVDDLPRGTGIELGYIVNPPRQRGESDDAPQKRMIIPSAVSDNIPRLKAALEMHQWTDFDIDEGARIIHLKEWGPTWRSYGLPGIMASLNSAVRYMNYTGEWVVMQRVWRTYAMLVTGYSNNKGLNQIGANFANRLSGLFDGTAGTETNNATGLRRTPPVGMAAISGMNAQGMQGTRIDPVRTAGSTDPPAMGREIRLLAEMGMGYPDNMFSDTNTGTMSRADALERNTHLKFLSAQQTYGDMLRTISRMVVKFKLGDDKLEDTEITISWPAIVTPSTIEQIGALVQAYQGDGLPKRTYVEECLKVFKRADLHEIMQVLFPEDGDGMEMYSDAQMDQIMPMGGGGQGGPGQGGGQPDPNNPLSATESEFLRSEWFDPETIRLFE